VDASPCVVPGLAVEQSLYLLEGMGTTDLRLMFCYGVQASRLAHLQCDDSNNNYLPRYGVVINKTSDRPAQGQYSGRTMYEISGKDDFRTSAGEAERDAPLLPKRHCHLRYRLGVQVTEILRWTAAGYHSFLHACVFRRD
jgi:hypothetical protein